MKNLTKWKNTGITLAVIAFFLIFSQMIVKADTDSDASEAARGSVYCETLQQASSEDLMPSADDTGESIENSSDYLPEKNTADTADETAADSTRSNMSADEIPVNTDTADEMISDGKDTENTGDESGSQMDVPEEEPTATDPQPSSMEETTVSSDNSVMTVSAGQSGYAQSLQDGLYVIASSLDQFKTIDIAGGSGKAGANAQLYSANGSNAQKFQIAWNSEGSYYTIRNYQSGKYLDVTGGSSQDGANIQQYDGNGTNAQKWYIVPAGNGLYTILSVFCEKAVDVSCGSTADGTNIQLYSSNGTAAQKFAFLLSGNSISFSNGVYEIQSALREDKVLDVNSADMSSGANIQLYTRNGSDAQKFILTDMGDGTWQVTNLNSGKKADGADGNVNQQSGSGAASQKWYLRNTGDGTAYMVSASSPNRVLDVAGASNADGTNVQTYRENGTTAQKFYFHRLDYHPVTGEFTMACAGNTGEVLDIASGSRKMLGNLQIYSANGSNAQKFIIRDDGDGFVTISNVQSKHCLDICGSSMADAANVWQYRDSGSMAQKWIAHRNSDGSYTFINAHSSKALDVTNGLIQNGVNVQQYTYNGSTAQRFVLQDTTGTDSEPIDYFSEVTYVQVDVPLILQNPELPTGCESVALTMVLNSLGYSLSKTTIADHYLPKGSNYAIEFPGNPHGFGWGCFAPCITNTANAFLTEHGSSKRAYNISGTSQTDLMSYIDKGIPVIVWSSMYMRPVSFTGSSVTYQGKTYNWYRSEHCVVISGYKTDHSELIINDSLDGIVKRNWNAFENIYNMAGQNAVVIM